MNVEPRQAKLSLVKAPSSSYEAFLTTRRYCNCPVNLSILANFLVLSTVWINCVLIPLFVRFICFIDNKDKKTTKTKLYYSLK